MRQTARDKFNKGDRVRPSRSAVARKRVKDPDRLGTVVGVGGKHPEVVWIVRDGNKSWEDFHMDDWDRVQERWDFIKLDPAQELA